MRSYSLLLWGFIGIGLVFLKWSGALRSLFNTYSFVAILTVLFALYYQSVVIVIKTLPRDLRFVFAAVNSLVRVKLLERNGVNLIQLFRKNVAKNPHKICFYFEDEKWTFKEVDEFSNKIANVFKSEGYQKGDVVALLMSNSAAYVAIWLGLAKLGVITALINSNLRNQPLLHTIRNGKAKGIIYSPEFWEVLEELSEEIRELPKFQFGGSPTNKAKSLDSILEKASSKQPLEKEVLGYRDPILYIYTSGTTGLPKAAIITNVKCMLLAYASWHVMGLKENDCLYNTLPLYHTAGGILGIVSTLVMGFPVVIRKKFSASQYWTDCIRYKCTIGIYIGEMCRYILAVPPKPVDKLHELRIFFGNGMRSTVWADFVSRFNIGQICELYGSTEGNTNLINVDKTIGAVGFLPKFLPRWIFPMDLIRVDESGQPVRGTDGLCIRCKPGEPGTFVGKISKVNSSQEFAGYVGGAKENSKKILENVFCHGDKVFWSGDLLVMDDLGYIYFKDRLGDTFRWKGENVSTAEVETVLAPAVDMLDITVYGVEVGNLEGRAGMATIVDPENKLDLNRLAEKMDKSLPSYARPLFIRITKQVDITGTFKLKKTDLQKENYNPAVVKDALYFRQGSKFVELTQDAYEDITNNRIRF